ncbi:thialysine N-epsilon-acetyltransferase isoform X2 [Episyrphus balteatus]|uniref:thialysine N-epsilon-acetyltransferase isoform X2 n=1 Tax=Episyrphus balteatus TaxID=286459 RepID=UPI002486C402|nr:thialysine N-epsilon-acetyltransferase isoform X2 [Episyrphus balteatus]
MESVVSAVAQTKSLTVIVIRNISSFVITSYRNMEEISTKSFRVRRAEANDMQHVRQMIQELADFEQMSSGPELSVEDLIRDGGFDGGNEIFHCYIAETTQMDGSTLNTERIGYAICHFSYSTWQGKSYELQSLYIKEEFRNKSFGKKLFIEIAKNAKTFGCKRINFHVLDWNPARKFYEHMGARNLTELEAWQLYRLNL